MKLRAIPTQNRGHDLCDGFQFGSTLVKIPAHIAAPEEKVGKAADLFFLNNLFQNPGTQGARGITALCSSCICSVTALGK